MVQLEQQVAVIGAAGNLGHALRSTFPNALFLDIRDTEPYIQRVDITKCQELEHTLQSFGPSDWIINAAAYTKVDDVETPEGRSKSLRANVIGPRNLATLALSNGPQIVHISTAYVFDGRNGMYKEDDETNPLNIYGRHKLAGERPILNSGGIVLRTDVLYGQNGENFVDTIIVSIKKKLAEDIHSIEVVNDQIGSPTYTADLAQMVKAVIEHPDSLNGPQVFHAVNKRRVSRADLVREIIKFLGYDCTVIDVSTEQWNQEYRQGKPTAERPRDCSLDTAKLEKIYTPRDWKVALREYLTKRYMS